jgi:hypothetical protein
MRAGRGRKPLRAAALLLALCAGSVAASSATIPAAASTAGRWTADPDDQYLLDVNIRQLRLGDGVRAYNTPEGTCVVLGDFLTSLDVPMHIDLAARRASGWAFKESNRISIDYAAGTVTYGSRGEPIGVKPVTSGSVLVLESEAKLPVELAAERRERAKHIHPASFNLATLPQVRIPYRMWRAPALDFVVSGGMTYRATDGVKVDRQSSVYAAGEIARLSYDAQMTTTARGMPAMLRLRAYRSDPDAHLLGPLKATHFGFGDVEGFDSRLTGSVAAGRGGVVTNRPLAVQTAFDRTRFEGDLPSGWEAEIYRNDELLAFAKSDGNQRYVFDDVQLLYGDNRIRIVLYGPQGQIKTREELINVGQDNVPPGKTWYWAGVNQPGKDILSLHDPPSAAPLPKAQGTVSLEHGLDQRTSVGVLARMMLIDDQKLTFVEGSVRRSIGAAIVEVSAARESNGGTAAHAQILGKIGPVNVNAEALIANDFHLHGGTAESERDYRVALDAPVRLGRSVFPAHSEMHFTKHVDGSSQLDAAARLSANLDRFNLATDVAYKRQYAASGPSPPGQVSLGMIGTGHVGGVRLRGSTTFAVSPAARFSAAELSAYWSASEKVDWEGDVEYDSSLHRARARITHVRRLDAMAIALTGEAASDGSVALGFNLSFSLDAQHGLTLSRQPLAEAGMVHALVYRDLNGNGLRDPAEPLEKGALVTTGTHGSDRATDAAGSVVIGGLPGYIPVTVAIDQTSLDDPMLVPEKALQVVVPRPGVAAEVQIGLVGGGDIEGAVVKNGGMGFEGLDLELVDSSGKTIGTARSDYDGFFLFDRVPYGHYSVRVAKESAVAARVLPDLALSADITPEKPVARLGAVHVTATPVIASAGPSPATP